MAAFEMRGWRDCDSSEAIQDEEIGGESAIKIPGEGTQNNCSRHDSNQT
jgi:hypothetical protein